jgi:hypothetical protein
LRGEVSEAEDFVFENLQAGLQGFCKHGSEAYGESISLVPRIGRASPAGQPKAAVPR